jgi:hypothetical protein
MVNDLDHTDALCRINERFIDRLQFALQKATSACKMPKPIDGPIDASCQIKGDQ